MRKRTIFHYGVDGHRVGGLPKPPRLCRGDGRSAQAFDQYFQALQQEPLNPVERVMFSLVLANAKSQHALQAAGAFVKRS